jgi:TolB-like protein/DNA-binding winged helix-turn-helix (wHTH) protein/Tfp pilus assembly protein PilF
MPEVPPLQRVSQGAFRINDLRVDPTLGLLTGPQGSAHLEPRILAVLQVLARHAGTLVSRTDLLSGIWPGADTYDEALTQCVYQLRQQLVSVGGPQCRNLISTVPKRGYLLNAEVHPVAAELLDHTDQTGDTRARRQSRLFVIGMLAVALVVGGIWGIFEWRAGTDAAATMSQSDVVAVLPFLPLVEADRDPVLELGMADTLIARLAGIRQIVVRPISSVRRYADLDRDTLAAGRELGADAVVEGSIQRSGQGLRVIVRLLRVSDGAALWADTFHESSASIFEVQDAICERIAAALAQEFGRQLQQQPARAGTSDTEAYELYLKGRYHLARLTRDDMFASIDYFRQALSRDPDYAQAWLGLASVQFRMPLAGETPSSEFYPKAKSAAQKALEIDPTLAEGHAMLGWIAFWYDWDWVASEAHFRRAIELDPNETESHLGYAHLLSNTGRHDQALNEVRRARELSPFFQVAAALEGDFLLRAQRVDEAIQRLEDARLQYENFWLIRKNLAETYLAAGRDEDALAEARVARRASGGHTSAIALEIASLARLGRVAEAEAQLSELLQRADKQYASPYYLAVACHGAGDPDEALAWLERAYQARDPALAFLGVGAWESLRDRPEYVDLMRRMDLADLLH